MRLHDFNVSSIKTAIVRSVRILEYAYPVWAALPKYLDDIIESVQKKGPTHRARISDSIVRTY